MDRIALDTTFLIDLQNERRLRGATRGATAYLRANPKVELALPAIALAEYLEGFEEPDAPEARALVSTLRVLDVTERVATMYARTARVLRASGRLIGTNDLWIACTARAWDLPIATRNVEHFSRVPELQVVSYAP